MVEQNWLSPQMKRSVIIVCKLLVAKHNNDINNNNDNDNNNNELNEALQTHLL